MSLDLAPVAAEAVRASPLARRVVLVVDGKDRPDWVESGDLLGVARAGASGLFAQGLPRLFGNFEKTGAAGVGRLAPYGDFIAAVRALTDDLLDDRNPGWVLESVPSGTPLDLARAVYPDALVASSGDRLSVVLRAPAPSGGPGPPAPIDLTDHLILIVGAPRSGTTWFEQLLLSHPLTGGVDEAETWLFRGLVDVWANLRDRGGLETIADHAAVASALRCFSTRLFAHAIALTPSASWFVEKTPGHVFLLPEIASVWPDAWVLNLVRDGRDVARSGLEMEHGPNDVREAATAWVDAIAAADRDGPLVPRFREVRYESLLADPVTTAADVFRWVGLAVDDPALAGLQAAAGRRVSQYNTTGPVGAGKWQSLDPADLLVILAIAGDALGSRGYVAGQEVAAARRALRSPQARLAGLRRRLRDRRSL